MSIKDFDYLSRKIGVFFYGRRRHASIVGGILTIIMVVLCAIYIGYLLQGIYQHKSANFVSYTRYQNNIDGFSFNNSKGLFHFLNFFDIKKEIVGEYNTKYVRIFITNLHYTNIINIKTLENTDHWIYDKCKKGVDDKNLSEEIINDNKDDFFKGACLRYYYNHINKTYYSIEDKLYFKYPNLSPKNKNNTESMYLNTIIEKCRNSSISSKVLGYCANENEINEYFSIYKGIYLNLLEYQVNANNYSEPIIQYINKIYTEISDSNTTEFQINNINLSPLYIEVKKGLLFPKTQKINNHVLKNNIQSYIHELYSKNIISVFDYKIVNLCNVFQGRYDTLYDILPSFGGIIQLIYYILFCFNYFIDNIQLFKIPKIYFLNLMIQTKKTLTKIG